MLPVLFSFFFEVKTDFLSNINDFFILPFQPRQYLVGTLIRYESDVMTYI